MFDTSGPGVEDPLRCRQSMFSLWILKKIECPQKKDWRLVIYAQLGLKRKMHMYIVALLYVYSISMYIYIYLNIHLQYTNMYIYIYLWLDKSLEQFISFKLVVNALALSYAIY